MKMHNCGPEHRSYWRVSMRHCYNHYLGRSYILRESKSSEVCCLCCMREWRTSAKYVDELPNADNCICLGPEVEDD